MLLTNYKPGGKTSAVLSLILQDHLPCRLSPFSPSFLLSPCFLFLSILNLIFCLYFVEYIPQATYSYFSLPSYPNTAH